MPRFLIIGNPDNRRTAAFCEAAMAQGCTTGLLSWIDILNQPLQFRDELRHENIVRIESPGENPDVERLLIERGATASGVGDAPWSGEFGQIENSSLWYAGFCETLDMLKMEGNCGSCTHWMNHPDDIAVMFDKGTCQSLLQSASISVPRILGFVRSYHELQTLMQREGTSRVFLKLPHSSSASGVVAFQTNGSNVIAQTSVEVVQQKSQTLLYNSLKVRRYIAESEIARLVDALGVLGLHVEQWVPKAGIDGRIFDLRVLVIAGRARHVVVRTSHTPMTNLHLGNARGNLTQVRQQISTTRWDQAMRTCEKAAACFPRSHYVAVDLMFTPGFRRHFVAEVNAFGDLLPNVLHESQTTYEAEIAEFVTKAGQPDVGDQSLAG